MSEQYDLCVVGAGIAGLACALEGLKRGWRVQVIDRDPRCVGASIRNFGFITVTGQSSLKTWQRARLSRDIWAEVAQQANIPVLHKGLYVTAQRPLAKQVLQELLGTPQGQALEWVEREALLQRAPELVQANTLGALYSPHEIRVEANLAIEQLRQWLALQGVIFLMGVAATRIAPNLVTTTHGEYYAKQIVVCPGPDIRSLLPEFFSENSVQLCKLQMLRIKPPENYRLPAGVMSDLSLVRYAGYCEMPASNLLKRQLETECEEALGNGIHLIIVQSADGTLVVGDSHHYGQVVEPFASAAVEQIILREMQSILNLPYYEVVDRWVGTYPSSPKADAIYETVMPSVKVLSVTSGTGMSTSFALAKEALQ